MRPYIRLIVAAALLLATLSSYTQTLISGRIIDNITKEPIEGASIHCSDRNCICGSVSNQSGLFRLECTDCRQLFVTSIGYSTYQLNVASPQELISLQPSQFELKQVVVSANRGMQTKRSEAPIAISIISSRTIQETKAITVDQLLNKVSGVNMVNLGNEQHQMSIRQPMTTKSLFLYLEDGIPIRTTGLFNHNALLEMNMAATKTIEVIKGPSSSLYGSEAIGGVVNFISNGPTSTPVIKISSQLNNLGYKRADLSASGMSGKWGYSLAGYYASRKHGFVEFTDFHKAIATARIDYHFSDKTSLVNSITAMDYYSDMPGGIDSNMFVNRSFTNPHTFTYRKVHSLRVRSSLIHDWNDKSKTSFTMLFRQNAIGQNPSYRVKDDYRRQGNGFSGDKTLAHGEVNTSNFNSYAVIAQHRQTFDWKKASLTVGASTDLSPSGYRATYIRIHKDTLVNKYNGYKKTDSVLTNYNTALNNYAAFINGEVNLSTKLRLTASVRYDRFIYKFDNQLSPSSFTGAPDTTSNFHRVSPKVGFTYNINNCVGFYANYSEGFVPPQVSELYTGVKVPNLGPATFRNLEMGGWIQLVKNKVSADASIYSLQGKNEIISVKLDDGSFANENAGSTSHRGIEFGVTANLNSQLNFRVSGAYSRHKYTSFIEKGNDYSGNDMTNAPRWIYNAETWYRPTFLRGFRIGAEWQHVGEYFANQQNTASYAGYDVLNLRTACELKGFEIWLNFNNVTNNYYSFITTKSNSGYSYQLADPINVNVGIAYNFNSLLK